ncbi:transcriptional regulator [Halobium palmae]|uniref:Transcriptional regulator n=1 Tax=Halobium palmae TaxID=1776492 RepID=A0ABD5RVH9_9EURY
MADLNAVAKRLHNVSPDPVELTFDDGSTGVFRLDWTEFFQREFRAEGCRDDVDDDATYRFVTSEDNERVLVARRESEDDDWSVVGSVVEASAA